MSRTENEQEFVLGNRQLLSAFFVVVMLLGVFFAMGYIIGQGSTKKPTQAESAPPATSSASTDTTPAPTPAPQTPAAEPEAPPKRTEVAAVPVVTEPVRTTAERRAEERPEPTRIESTPTHKYLQVSAVKRPAADSIVKTLKDKGFPALLGESSKPELFRVLVGPYSETEALSKAKTDLKAIISTPSFPNNSGYSRSIDAGTRASATRVGSQGADAFRVSESAEVGTAGANGYGVRIGAVSEYPRMFSPGRGNVHDPGQPLHAGMRVLFGAEGASGEAGYAARSAGAGECCADGGGYEAALCSRNQRQSR